MDGVEVEIGGVDAAICGKCYEGLSLAIEEDEPHVTIGCPKCDHVIGLRIEVIGD
jgi:hypothetical protein